jgi:ribosome-binding protein aMBF1 (putative translation factor)
LKAEQRVLRQVGIRIPAARRKRGLPRSELATSDAVNSSRLGSIERGENNTNYW